MSSNETVIRWMTRVTRLLREEDLDVSSAHVIEAVRLSDTLASLPAVRTRMVVFDTAVVDLTPEPSDHVELLFGAQLGGGTDINRALGDARAWRGSRTTQF